MANSFTINFLSNQKATAKNPGILAHFAPVSGAFDSVAPVLIGDLVSSFLPQYIYVNKSLDLLFRHTYINLSSAQSFWVKLSPDVKFAQFSCSSGTVLWDDRDLSKLQGKTAAEAIAAGLSGNIVLIGDATDTFEMLGEQSPGPFVFRSSYWSVQIIKVGSIYQVHPMLLGPLKIDVNLTGSTPGSAASQRTYRYIADTKITPNNQEELLVQGGGNIQLPPAPVDKFTFWVNDRWDFRLAPGRNDVLPSPGQTIGVGQGPTTIDHTTPWTWETADKGSYTEFVYDAGTSNWRVFLDRQGGVLAAGQNQAQSKPAIITGNTPTFAQPFDTLRLGGNGDIDLRLVTREGEFISIIWQPGDVYALKLLCPIGFTIGGDNADFLIETALTGVSRLTFTLVGTNYGVSA